MNQRFVSCTATSCPMNSDKQCRAPFLMVDQEGKCLIMDNGPHECKSPTENYVDIKECRCKGCNHWELNESGHQPIGSCGLGADLFFRLIKDDDGVASAGCHDFQKQIKPPDFTAAL